MLEGDIETFGEIVESEALTLHAMMMTSLPYFILMKPNTLEVINAVWAYRKETGNPLYFTLDAGANVHLLYPESHKEVILEFIDNSLRTFCKDGSYLCDYVGLGPTKH
jgi:diphosphomevalonate decarboxylase